MDFIYARRLNNQLCIDYLYGQITSTQEETVCEGSDTEGVLGNSIRVSCYGGDIPCNGCYMADILTSGDITLIGWAY